MISKFDFKQDGTPVYYDLKVTQVQLWLIKEGVVKYFRLQRYLCPSQIHLQLRVGWLSNSADLLGLVSTSNELIKQSWGESQLDEAFKETCLLTGKAE